MTDQREVPCNLSDDENDYNPFAEMEAAVQSMTLLDKIKRNEGALFVSKREIAEMNPSYDPDSCPDWTSTSQQPKEKTPRKKTTTTTDTMERSVAPDEFRKIMEGMEYSPSTEMRSRESLMQLLANDLDANNYDYIANILVKLPYLTVLDFFQFFYSATVMTLPMVKAYIRGAGSTHVQLMAVKGMEMAQKFSESMTSCVVLASEFKEMMQDVSPGLISVSTSVTSVNKEIASLKAELQLLTKRLRDPVMCFDKLYNSDPVDVMQTIKAEFKRTADLTKAAEEVTEQILKKTSPASPKK